MNHLWIKTFSMFPRNTFAICTKAVQDLSWHSIREFTSDAKDLPCKYCSQGQNNILLCKNTVTTWFIMQLLTHGQASFCPHVHEG